MTRKEYTIKQERSKSLSESMLNAISYITSLEKHIAELEEDVRQRECLEIDATATIRSLRECITELEAPRTCRGCKYLSFSDDRTCEHKDMSSYYGMSFEINTFYCSNYEQKDIK